ncbi:MAG: hypothetical protein H0U37_05215 [Chloroflexi bacterium]|nr:hypothetical protein [Chloroflexota bacterium]
MQEANPTMPGEAPPRQAPATPGPGAEPALADARALQILTTEHWSLLATRSLAYNEAFSRASMFLSFLSATLIVIGFLVSSLGLSPTVGLLASILLGADLFIGFATLSRLKGASAEELQCVRGMNRIRHAYREMVPGLEPYFVSGFHDDARGVLATYGDVSPSVVRNIIHGLGTSIGMISTIDAMILGALCASIGLGLGLAIEVGLVLAITGFAVAFGLLTVVGMRTALGRKARAESRFPTPD